MAQKRVSFKVAKAIKEAGYPQKSNWWYNEKGKMFYALMYTPKNCYAAPTYLDVWPWLCKEKGIRISSEEWHAPHEWGSCIEGNDFYDEIYGYAGPIETVIAAIEYLVDNNLIK